MSRFPLCLAVFAVLLSTTAAADGWVGGYILMSKTRSNHIVGLSELAKLAADAKTLPVNRIWLAFFSPTMVYVPGSKTLAHTGLNVSMAGDYGFSDVKKYIGQLTSGGVEVYLSMGGWNYNCFPYLYARYSVGGYGSNTPNYWKIQKYGGGNIDNCVASNQYCYVCEPPSQGTTLTDFSIFPEPLHSATFQEAVKFVAAHAGGSHPPAWDPKMIPGHTWTDSKTGISTMVPGNPLYHHLKRDPYQDIVYLARDLNATGIDLDYEEFWHADYFKYQAGGAKGPWTLPQTVYKYAAIAKDIQLNIGSLAPHLKMSTAAGAVGAWSGKWWGGNLKGVWLHADTWYPEIVSFMAKGANAGGINVMSYDLSDDEKYHECPSTSICTLPKQVAFYLGTYKTANIVANVGYEVGTPAYPSPTHDKSHQLPLTKTDLSQITSGTQSQHPGGFMWSLFKPKAEMDNASPTEVAQAICNVVMKGSSRCTGTIPAASDL